MDETDRAIINALQGGFPICDAPYASAAQVLGLDEATLISRLRQLVTDGTLSRFGPMYNAEQLGGAVTLAAMSVPADRLETVVTQINAHPEVAHNYERTHALNVWFVVATERPDRITEVLHQIEAETGLPIFNMPKSKEYFIGLRLTS